MNKQKILLLFLVFSILTGVLSYNLYQSIYGELITKDCIVFIGSSDTISAIEKTLSKQELIFFKKVFLSSEFREINFLFRLAIILRLFFI